MARDPPEDVGEAYQELINQQRDSKFWEHASNRKSNYYENVHTYVVDFEHLERILLHVTSLASIVFILDDYLLSEMGIQFPIHIQISLILAVVSWLSLRRRDRTADNS